jgi:hypothetical protein
MNGDSNQLATGALPSLEISGQLSGRLGTLQSPLESWTTAAHGKLVQQVRDALVAQTSEGATAEQSLAITPPYRTHHAHPAAAVAHPTSLAASPYRVASCERHPAPFVLQ